MWLTIISIIFSLIQAAPEIEAIIKEIIALLHHQPLTASVAFTQLLLNHQANPAAAKQPVLDFHAKLKAAVQP